jgi:hypothetical protein
MSSIKLSDLSPVKESFLGNCETNKIDFLNTILFMNMYKRDIKTLFKMVNHSGEGFFETYIQHNHSFSAHNFKATLPFKVNNKKVRNQITAEHKFPSWQPSID